MSNDSINEFQSFAHDRLSMIDCENITHSISKEERNKGIPPESSCVKAIKMDNDGLGKVLGFGNGMLPMVDYCAIEESKCILMELSDLRSILNIIKSDLDNIQKEYEKSEKNRDDVILMKNKKKEAWGKITYELQKKWCGSIAVMERYQKYQAISNGTNFCGQISNTEKAIDYDYSLYIVLRNKNDVLMFETLLKELSSRLSGMCGTVSIFRTKDMRLDNGKITYKK